MTETIKPKRQSRYIRSENPPNILVTARDIEIFKALSRYRFLTQAQLGKLLDVKSVKFGERLSQLFHNGFIDKPQAQYQYFSTIDKIPTVYALASKGKEVLVEKEMWLRGNIDYTSKNKKIKRDSIQHTLFIADIMVSVEAGCRQKNVRFIQPEEILQKVDSKIKRTGLSLYWQIDIFDKGEKRDMGIIPDYIFGLEYENGGKAFFFVEADRGTMPVMRSRPRQTSLAAKMQGYIATFNKNKETAMFGFKMFRSIFVVPSEKRLGNMAAALSEITDNKGTGLFLFSTLEEITKGNPLELEIRDGKGGSVSLYSQK